MGEYRMSKKLEALRAEMARLGVDGFIVPRADEFHGEYVPASNDRLAWITGFTGSAGSAVILKNKAALFTDGRYTLQAQAQVDKNDFEVCSLDDETVRKISPNEWIAQNLPSGAKLGVYAWAHAPRDIFYVHDGENKGLRPAAEKAGGQIVLLDENPLDAAWKDRPAPPRTPAVPHPLEFSGKPSSEKRADVAATLKAKDARALVIAFPEEICWLFNVRGNDVPCTPFSLSYAIVHADGTADWFIDQHKVPQETRQWVGGDVRIHDFGDFPQELQELARQGGKIWIDPSTAPVRVQNIVMASGARAIEAASPIQLMKSKKNAVELQGMINAHIRDGVAETRFLSAILAPGAAAKLDEISASDMLEGFRAKGDHFKGLSFDTISGAGGNGAIVHYRSTPETCQPLLSGPVYLVDSGAQYLDGTTDITRTVAVDPAKITPEMKDAFTRVLKGHIQVAMSVFPEGTTGVPLDVKARAALKETNLNYTHGTGHGVGSYLSVHEGPCSISSRSTTPFEPGMIVSNEPGFYKTGEYGIRIENLVAVEDTGRKDEGGKRLFALRTLTLAPIDRNLTEPALLTQEELGWLNDYHETVRNTLLPHLEKLDPPAAAYLKEATAPIGKPPAPGPRKINGFAL
jgi:Xaa-Pro aminopeptidase